MSRPEFFLKGRVYYSKSLVCVGGGRGGEGVVGEESSKSMVAMLSSLNKGFLCFLTIVSNKKTTGNPQKEELPKCQNAAVRTRSNLVGN